MKYEEMSEKLLIEFPKLQEEVEKLKIINNTTKLLTYEIFEGAFNLYLFEILNKNKDKKEIIKIFIFLENMAKSIDLEVQNLLQVAILEYIWGEKEIRDLAILHMGNETKKLIDQVKLYLS